MPTGLSPRKPAAILIYAGDNDLALGTAPETVFSSFKNPLEPGRLPDLAAGYRGIPLPPEIKNRNLLTTHRIAICEKQALVGIESPSTSSPYVPAEKN
jgi:hypothetical protein